MTLLPEVERELGRAARSGLPWSAGAPARPASGPRRRAGSGWRLAAVVALVGIVLAAGFLTALVRRPARSPAGAATTTLHHGHRQASIHRSPSPVAPYTQPGTWEGGDTTCPLAAPERGLPTRSGCVSVVHADVTGAGHPDLVALYATLGRRRCGHHYAPRHFTLAVISDRRTVSQVRVPHVSDDSNVFLARVGDMNARSGAELIVAVDRTSSGSSYDLYTWRDGGLDRVPILLAAGGDSGSEGGFACRPGSPSLLVQVIYVLGRGGLHGRWRWTTTTDAWHGATLRRISRRTFTRRGIPSQEATTDGAGCGRQVGSAPSSIRR